MSIRPIHTPHEPQITVKPEKVSLFAYTATLVGVSRTALVVLLVALSPVRATSVCASPEAPLWARVAAASQPKPAEELAALIALVDADEEAGRPAAAAAALERALPRLRGAEQTGAWFRLGVVRSKLGRYREASVAYGAAVASGAADPAVYANFGEVLMADGRLADAQARYRDAIGAANEMSTADKRARSQDLALGYYGLAVALDRDEQTVAAREMMQRALANDPASAVLKIASQPGGDLFFVPDGDVFYYLGLAAEVEGRGVDAEAAFREFLARTPQSRWARAAQAHLGIKKGSGGARATGGARAALRIAAHGTVLTAGAMPAPLIDAAWRDQLPILDECLDVVRAPPGKTLRVAIELSIDERGKVTQATAKLPEGMDARFGACLEKAGRQRLRLPEPPRPRRTNARTEFVLSSPSSSP
jgi:Tfp pilus assembly protein PilF